MEWKEFTESTKEYPEKVVEIAIAGFSKATKGLVEMNIMQMNDMGRLTSSIKNDFLFNVYLRSQVVKGYSLKVFSFGYNVEMAPIAIAIEESIFEEIFERRMLYSETVSLENEVELKRMLERIFQSKKFTEIVTGIMKIAKKNISK